MAQKKQLSINIDEDTKFQLQNERESEVQENQPRTYQDKTPLSPCQPATGTSPDSPFSYSSLKKKMTMDLKQEYDSEELLFQLEDELMVLENIKRKLEKSIQKNDKIQQDICIAEYCSIVERVVQSIKILSQRKQNISEKYELNIEQDEKLETLTCQFNIFYEEYQKSWSQQLKESFHNFISMAKPLRLDSLQISEDMDKNDYQSRNASIISSESHYEQVVIKKHSEAGNQTQSQPQQQPSNEIQQEPNHKKSVERKIEGRAISKCKCLLF